MNPRQWTREDSEIFMRILRPDSPGSVERLNFFVEYHKADNQDFQIMLERETFEPPEDY